jgi:uncharacterized protein with NAD-binding domain and iron-sulfur cluster
VSDLERRAVTKRVLIIGGGMAGLTAAWHLSREDDHGEEILVTVHQRDGILGGKGASVRGARGRIEEHGLHIWMGYYQNAFRLMREVYGELDRPHTRPQCPIRTVEEAFEPVTDIGVCERLGAEGWELWLARFPRNAVLPGETDADPASARVRSVSHLLMMAASVVESAVTAGPPLPRVLLSTEAAPPRPTSSPVVDVIGRVTAAELAGLAEVVRATAALASSSGPTGAIVEAIGNRLAALRDDVVRTVERSIEGRRMQTAIDLLLTCAVGAVRDGLLESPAAYHRSDDLDFREWLLAHGADPSAAFSPIVEGMYDLVFAYERGDRRRPRFSAGLGVLLASHLFFAYRGAIFWRMRAGMGDVVFAPLYEALRQRDVHFELHSELVELVPDASGRTIERLVLRRGGSSLPEARTISPLQEVGGLPCFPAEPADPAGPDPPGVAGADRADEVVELIAGADFDVVILAVPAGALRSVAARLIAVDRTWATMVERLGVVSTQAMQVWFTRGEAALGYARPGAIVSAHEPPFDTCASMSHVLPFERAVSAREERAGSPGQESTPRALAYFCGVLPDGDGLDAARANARDFLSSRLGGLFPHSADARGDLDWGVLDDPDDRTGPERLAAPYVRANSEPWEGYVQSLPGSGRHRLRTDRSGFDNLFLAGDWIDCGLNAGCIEAAAISGLQAANAVHGRPIGDGVLGGWEPVTGEREAP